ncbi:putative phosphatidate phosphatase isoform X2 [Eurosta solidaginis]|uniref:putative phosphatidate phosphatase isoform X2 n=1 Tax=Eurosta solidaginis TaxID=178769 RepID=UPI003530F8B9
MKDHQFTSEDRRLLHRILLDFIIAVVLFIPIIVCEFVIEPYQRGFFCSDETIRYPFHENTMSILCVALLVIIIPIVIVITVEYTRYYRCSRINKTCLLFGRKVPIWLAEFFKHASYLIFGGLLTYNATEVGKYTIGRLRPHFISVCQPQLADGSTCDAPQNIHRYVEAYTCVGIGYTPNDLREARISFPSGHSCMIFYTMLYLIIYLQHKFTWRGSKFSRYFLQFALLMLAWFTALSRIMDNYHHWSDVLCGCVLGIVGALITTTFIVKDFCTPFLERVHVNLPRQDTSTTLDEMTATMRAYTQSNGVGGDSPLNGESLSGDSAAPSLSNYQYCTKVSGCRKLRISCEVNT